MAEDQFVFSVGNTPVRESPPSHIASSSHASTLRDGLLYGKGKYFSSSLFFLFPSSLFCILTSGAPRILTFGSGRGRIPMTSRCQIWPSFPTGELGSVACIVNGTKEALPATDTSMRHTSFGSRISSARTSTEPVAPQRGGVDSAHRQNLAVFLTAGRSLQRLFRCNPRRARGIFPGWGVPGCSGNGAHPAIGSPLLSRLDPCHV